MTEQPQEQNGRVTNALILYRLEQMEIKFDLAIAKLDTSAKEREALRLSVAKNEKDIVNICNNDIPEIKKDVEKLQSRSNWFDAINALLVVIGTFLGINK